MATSRLPMSSSEPHKSFITEVDQREQDCVTCTSTSSLSSSRSGGQSNGDLEGEEVRPPEEASGVFQILDKMGEKQQHSKHLRNLMQRAAQKTILVVRAKNSMQAAEVVSIRFSRHHLTDVPRCVRLEKLRAKVVRHAHFSSRQKQMQFQTLFAQAHEVDALLKDMFWYLTAHCFQPGRHTKHEASFYQRIADSFTALFIRLQMQPASRDSGFFDLLPDILAQILFVALYEAFPRSRKTTASADMRREILRTCYCWILGFVPSDLSYTHWLAVEEDSPKRMAALADFPAMRNRMLRLERVERTKQAVRTRHEAQEVALVGVEPHTPDILNQSLPVDDTATPPGESERPDDPKPPETKMLPRLQTPRPWRRSSTASVASISPNGLPTAMAKTRATASASREAVVSSAMSTAAQVETRERGVYEMCHSPLIGAFLQRHQLEANTPHLRVQLRLTSGKQRDLSAQEALRAAVGVIPSRRRRLVDPSAFADALTQLEGFGDAVRLAYARERHTARRLDSRERRQLANTHRELEGQLGELRQHGEKLHAFSNQLVSKARIDALLVPSGSPTVPTSDDGAVSSGVMTSSGLVPRPPAPRRGRSSVSSATSATSVV